MVNRLKYHRVNNAKTQAEAAKAAGVTQPTYQRWETDRVEVPKAALAKLAKYFKATPAELLGTHPPLRAAFYDDSAPLDLQYYGEIAVHFMSGSEPLVLSISEAARISAYSQLHENRRFITFKDLGNRSVAIRREAISEFYFSSEAYDWYGPEEEHDNYKLGTPIQMPDTRDWDVIEAIYDEEIGAGDFTSDYPKEQVERVCKAIMITEEQWDKLVTDGHVKLEELETEKAARAADTAEILALAHTVTIQFSNGKRREIGYVDCNLFECWEQLEDEHHPYSDPEPGLIRLPYEGYHQTVFLNPEALDYVSFPTHKVEGGRVESYDDGLTDEGEIEAARDDAKTIKQPKAKKKPPTEKSGTK
ncbi:helix-turn-helix transcriptional regulator [Bradyrhizobium manausense]|uniref:helix-turn-helix domain-containing protein n=1 Tax=Bradyrhizobium manausense TaxID=989370 RepID=UPI001BA5501C|nr:helix-turn-helix transcriptional regulator [Bradyrhizobium manausense]MBR0686360.1 helix-turn-helix transcriptional regulator [Bradyrhizobium manausense]